MGSVPIADYEYVKAMASQPEKCLIDVRNPNELEEEGKIGHSINIPLPTLEEAFKLSDDEFKAKYGRDKPKPDEELVFHCKMGGRAGRAADAALGLGYKNVKNYKGSYTDWVAKEKK